jgi:hypothetical protein
VIEEEKVSSPANDRSFDSVYDILNVDEEGELFLDTKDEIILVPANIKPISGNSIVILDVEGERTTLPHLRPPNFKISFWTVLKEAIGKDITKVSMPVYFNEPLSMT